MFNLYWKMCPACRNGYLEQVSNNINLIEVQQLELNIKEIKPTGDILFAHPEVMNEKCQQLQLA